MIEKGTSGRFKRKFTTTLQEKMLRASLSIIAIACIGGAPVTAAPGGVSPDARIFADQASKLGARKCTGLYTVLGDLVSRGSAYTVRTEANKEAPDAHAVQGVVGMTYNLPDLKGQAAGLVFAAPAADGCEGHLVRIAPFQKPCQQIVKDLPPGSVAAANLSGVPLYQLGGNQGQALMIASGGSCVVVTVSPGRQQL